MAFKRGSGAKAKGSRFERSVRDELKRIYDSDRRGQIQRVPLSGASYLKGDVYDGNDNSWCYEAKNQEILSLPAWWKQAKSQTQAFQEPVLVFSSNHRPMYWCVLASQWSNYATQAGLPAFLTDSSTRDLYAKLAKLEPRECLVVELDGDRVAIINSESWLAVRRRLWKNMMH